MVIICFSLDIFISLYTIILLILLILFSICAIRDSICIYIYIYIAIFSEFVWRCDSRTPPPAFFLSPCHLVTLPQTRFWFPRSPCTVGYGRTCIAERLQVRLFLTERCVIIVGRLTMNGSGHLRMTHKLKNSNPVTRWQEKSPSINTATRMLQT